MIKMLVYFAVIFFVVGTYLADGCRHGTTMMIANPKDYTNVVVTNRDKVCTSSWAEKKTHVYISDCETDEEIVVVFGDARHSLRSGRKGNKNWTVTILCNHSPEIVETEHHNSPLDRDVMEQLVIRPLVSESASFESECLWLFMVWLALKMF